jgi:hypothetical protein
VALDPRLMRVDVSWPTTNDYRLRHDCPAIDAGVVLPAEWPDSRRDADAEKPDIGALPQDANPFLAGRYAEN